MKPWFLLLIFCACSIYSGAQLSLPGSVSEDQSIYTNPDDGKITGTYQTAISYTRDTGKKNWHGHWNSWYDNGQKLDSGFMKMGIPDKTWAGWYSDGTVQFIRTLAEKWQQFQLEKLRYHPKRISLLPHTALSLQQKRAEKYISAINSFCVKITARAQRKFITENKNNSIGDHYHPLLENGLLHGHLLIIFPGPLKIQAIIRMVCRKVYGLDR
jgi:hypothetical protein